MFDTSHAHYDLIATAIRYLVENQISQPNLTQLSERLSLSETHLQRVFSEWAGVSPKQFIQYLTKESAKQKLRQTSVLDAANACGLSSASRLHDLMITWEGMTPGEYKKLGENLTIHYGLTKTPFGFCFMAVTERGICRLAFINHSDESMLLENDLKSEWQNATLLKDDIKIAAIAKNIFSVSLDKKPLKLLMKGTPFQMKVWEALLAIPEGELVTYQTIANHIKHPKAVRAAASAIANNQIAYLIPCHRVIRQTGEFGQFRWDAIRKQALIGFEAAKNI